MDTLHGNVHINAIKIFCNVQKYTYTETDPEGPQGAGGCLQQTVTNKLLSHLSSSQFLHRYSST